MKTTDSQSLNATSGERMEEILRRLGQIPDLAALRRMVARLRSGEIHSTDPLLPSWLFAGMIEKSINEDLRVRSVARDIFELSQLELELEQQTEAERVRKFVADFHSLKKSARAKTARWRSWSGFPGVSGGTSWGGRGSGGRSNQPG